MKGIVTLASLSAVALLATPTYAKGGGGHYGSYSGGHARSASTGGITGTHTTRSYVRSDGTYVHSYRSTNPNSTRNDNWSTRGNTNPDTGKPGDKPRDGEGN